MAVGSRCSSVFGLVIQMTTWRKGRQLVAARIRRGERPIREVVNEALASGVARVSGVAVYMFKDEGAAPPALMSNLRHNRVMHSVVLLVSVHTADTPRVDEASRSTVTDLGNGIELVRLNYGFMEDPDIPQRTGRPRHRRRRPVGCDVLPRP